jgi:serine phosphatase RsbU (regulator of sigma subunit)
MPTPATVLFSSAPGSATGADTRKLISTAGYAVTDHALGATPAIDFDPVVVAVVEVGDRVETAAAQTRRWRAELGDHIIPVLWLAAPQHIATGLDAGADAVLPHTTEPAVVVAQLRALARLHSTASRVALRASEVRLFSDQIKKAHDQLDREQEMARRVHATFLPKSFPQVGALRFHVCYRQRSRVGGDFHDVRRLDEHHVGFFVGDVIGTSTAAGGLLGVFVQQSVVMKEITGHSYRVVPPNEVLAGVNRQLVGLGTDDLPLVAMLAGVVNGKTGNITIARAGLPAAVHIPASGAPGVWAVPGAFLGPANTTYQPLTMTLAPGDRLLVGTDGTRPDGDPAPASMDRMLEAATKHRSMTGADYANAVAGDLLKHVRHADDFTLLMLEMLG